MPGFPTSLPSLGMWIVYLICVLLLPIFASATDCSAGLPVHTIFQYPKVGHWLGNLAIRDNGSILTTDLFSPFVFQFNPFTFIPSPEPIGPFPNATGLTGITETAPGTFEVVAGNFKNEKNQAQPGSLRLYRVSFVQTSSPTITLTGSLNDIPLLNGLVALTSNIVLGSDSASGAVWSIDVRSGKHNKVVQDPLMSPMQSSSPNSSQLGINGLKIRKDSNMTYLYFTNTAKGIIAKLEIDPTSGAPVTADTTADIVATDAGAAKGVGFDDFAFSPDDGDVLYACNSRGNSISKVQLGGNPEQTMVAGNLNSTLVAEPSAAQFGRTKADGDVLYVVTAGGAGGPINGTTRVGAQLLAIDTKGNLCNGTNSSSNGIGGTSQNQTSTTVAFTGSATYLNGPSLMSVLMAITAFMQYL